MTDTGGAATAAPTALQIGYKGLCPRCGAQTLFVGPVHFAPTCRACGLDFTSFNVGDGPAAFLTLGVGALITLLALALDFAVRPPLWLHLILWPVMTLGAVVGGLRLTKAALLTAEYRSAAREGRIVE